MRQAPSVRTGLSFVRDKLVFIDLLVLLPKTVMCSFLVSAQETNQRKRPGEALSAKPFDAADFNQIVPRL